MMPNRFLACKLHKSWYPTTKKGHRERDDWRGTQSDELYFGHADIKVSLEHIGYNI